VVFDRAAIVERAVHPQPVLDPEEVAGAAAHVQDAAGAAPPEFVAAALRDFSAMSCMKPA